MDLQALILEAEEAGQESMPRIAKRFCVSYQVYGVTFFL
jgi:hypothetical protein